MQVEFTGLKRFKYVLCKVLIGLTILESEVPIKIMSNVVTAIDTVKECFHTNIELYVRYNKVLLNVLPKFLIFCSLKFDRNIYFLKYAKAHSVSSMSKYIVWRAVHD